MPTILPDPTHLNVDHIRLDADTITLVVAGKDERAPCPLCGQLAERVHSRYVRTLTDLPWNGVAVRLRLTVRRYATFCHRQLYTVYPTFYRVALCAPEGANATDDIRELVRVTRGEC